MGKKVVTVIPEVICLLSLVVGIAGCGGGGESDGGGDPFPRLITATAIVDVNGDGRNDLVMGSHGDGYSSPIVFINNGNSTYLKKTTAIPMQYKGANGTAVDIQTGDFNKDGKLDLLVSTVDITQTSFYGSAEIQLFSGNGDGTFSDESEKISTGVWPNSITGYEWPVFLPVVDIDGDGSLDFIATSYASAIIYRNDGTGNFAPANLAIEGWPYVTQLIPSARFVLVGDINNDGKPDLFAPDPYNSSQRTYINTSTSGAISFSQVTSTVVDFMQMGTLLDINGDGFLDVIGSPPNTTPSLVPVIAYLGDGTGNFTENNTVLSPQPSVVGVRQYLTADFNGDGKNDVLISDSGYDVDPFSGARNWLLINNGDGALIDKTSTNLDLIPAYTHQSAFGDLNGDGSLDIILNNASFSGNEPKFWLNNGTGVFTSFNPVIQ